MWSYPVQVKESFYSFLQTFPNFCSGSVSLRLMEKCWITPPTIVTLAAVIFENTIARKLTILYFRCVPVGISSDFWLFQLWRLQVQRSVLQPRVHFRLQRDV